MLDVSQTAKDTPVGNRSQAFEWYQFEWSWVTRSLDFKVTGLLLMHSTYCVHSWREICLR